MTNRRAIEALVRGELHAAVVHGDVTPQQARQVGEFTRFELATTESGWLVGHGNPLGLRGAADLKRTKARLANRPSGAGARRLLDVMSSQHLHGSAGVALDELGAFVKPELVCQL